MPDLRLLLLVIVSVLGPSSISVTARAQEQGNAANRRVEYGFFVQGGFVPNYVTCTNCGTGLAVVTPYSLQMYSAGVHAGIASRCFGGLRALSGRGEAMVEVLPFWLARYPPQTLTTTLFAGTSGAIAYTGSWKGENIPGASVTPFLLRWNFSQSDSQRVLPWLQVGGGLLWTSQKFPLNWGQNTSVVNFTPQVGGGVNIFREPKHSASLGFKFIHTSSAGLGDENPAIHDSLNFSLGYSWWK